MKFDHEKRRFIEQTVAMTVMGESSTNISKSSPRQLINRAHELWDEIEHQCPREEDKN